ncbi:MAG: 50S ribosomal protein L9 [Kofleriaceae bacterium]|nr:50S ribosomal protein L9 [Kofleriaceae bacterium]MBP9166894.1 50S ribosomal protein L9 [Kofleriaceae bacterium]MBP9861019.1 50S ribosomal protein L9 [Kofleriaceae bacterium]
MQIILTQDVPNLGSAGELVSVKPGYGRNYLVPRGLAVSATAANVHKLEHDKRVIAKKVAKEKAKAEAIAEKISAMTLQFDRQVGEEDKLFGSVTSRDVAEMLKKNGVEIDHRWVVLDQPVKALGKYEVQVKLGSGVSATVKFFVVSKAK